MVKLIIIGLLFLLPLNAEKIDILSNFNLEHFGLPQAKIASETGFEVRTFFMDFDSYMNSFYSEDVHKIFMMNDWGDPESISRVPKEKLVIFGFEPQGINSSFVDLFSRIYTYNDNLVDGAKYFKCYYPVLTPMCADLPDFDERKLCTMIAMNWNERRLQMLDFFSAKPEGEFEFYGGFASRYASSAMYRGPIPGHPLSQEKLSTQKNYRFCICFENTAINGYITEKIFSCFAAGCVPIYWGAPNVEEYIPKECFIDYRDFNNNEELYHFIKTMPEDVFQQYIDNIRIYLRSERAAVFSPEYFNKLISLEGALRAEERPFVTCRISGQLANQMNQIAATLAYAWDNDAEPYFPELNKSEGNISYNRDRFFFRLNSSNPPRSVKHTYVEPDEIRGYPIPFAVDQHLSGDFFCWDLFHRYRDRLLDVFAPSAEVVSYLRERYGWLINYPKTVSVHVRTYNKEYHTRLGAPFLGLEYYRKAMDLFPEDTVFVVFSDRIKWCEHHFSKFNKTIVCIEGNDHIQDFFLMSMMKDHIIANSCYSWWAAYIDDKPDRKVVAPRNWNRVSRRYTECIAFPDWTFVEADLDAPYPSDMKAYDAYSTSVDTQ